MSPEKKRNPLPVHKRIIFWLILPVAIVGTVISGALIGYLSPSMESFLRDNLNTNLRLASELGVEICDASFNQLLDMRLEDHQEMNIAYKKEALEQIKAVVKKVPSTHVMVLETMRFIKAISIDFPQDVWILPAALRTQDAIVDTRLGHEMVKAHIRYFPFWDWHIISFINEKDYMAPISTAHQIILISTVGVLSAVIATLFFVFYLLIAKPLNRLIAATTDISKGKLLPIEQIRENEIGQLMLFFNSMVASLKIKTETVEKLINQLKESEARYRSLVELSPEAVLVYQDKMIKYINPSGAKVFGATNPNELIGKPVLEIIHPAFYETVNARIQKVYRDHITLPSQELNYLTIEGKKIHVESIVTYIEYSGKAAMLEVIRDITARSQAEKALRESEEKLARSKKMESLGLLAGGVAHDLNNVLSGIVSYPDLILMDLAENSKFRKSIETIRESGHRAVAIVQDLLTVARGVAIMNEPLCLNDLIDDYLHSPEFAKLKQFFSTVAFRTHLDTGLFTISGSPVHIRKVIMNLVANASEAVEGSGIVTISTMNRYIDRPLKGYDNVSIGEYVVLSISDDGAGIPENDLGRIFEPFYTKKVMGRSGTGLGLAVVWNIMLDHKGYIDVITGAAGTNFELYFPVTREEIAGKQLSVPIRDYEGNGEMILVVDDEKSQRRISCKMLERLGYKTKSVSSGEQAIEYMKDNTADLILLDMIMDPHLNGRQTYERIIKDHPKQKAIIISGFAETDEVRAAQKLGAGQYLKKPVTLEKLGLAVREELAKNQH
jgi:two-component system cell cycle sensor histidine kinase/response regulator CckA